MEQQFEQHQRRDAGFTLIELLIAIVVVGLLSAVAIVGISSLVDSGEGAACSASQDAAQAAGAVYYANNNGTAPGTLAALVGDELLLKGGVTVVGNVMSRGTPVDWTTTYRPATNDFDPATPCP